MKFVDIFAGLGGFHLATASLGGKCVFACEINDTLRNLYEKNFGILPSKDIRQVDRTLVINPGESTDWITGKAQVVILDIENMAYQSFEL